MSVVRILPSLVRGARIGLHARRPVHAPQHVLPIPLSVRSFATRSEIAARAARAKAPFSGLVSALYAKIDTGLADIKEANPGFIVKRDGLEMAMTLTQGNHAGKTFMLTADEASRTVSFTSPKTGERFDYTFDPNKNGEWVSARDGTMLIEHLARDLVYHCKGYPNF
jgi:frataxin-like iron-binding protein CyaY